MRNPSAYQGSFSTFFLIPTERPSSSITGNLQVNIAPKKIPKISPEGKIEQANSNTLVSQGVNLLAVLSEEPVDQINTYSNDIAETLETLGIEACRNALLRFF